MSIEIIIDGYNLIYKWDILKKKFRTNPDDAREYLTEILSQYKKLKNHQIKLVFDAYNRYSFIPSNFSIKGIKTVFTPHGITADSYIKDIIRKNASKFIIVSSDNEIKAFADKQGASYINSENFIEKLQFAFYMDNKGLDNCDNNYSSRINTKKKGNPRKLPKKLRKLKNKINKL